MDKRLRNRVALISSTSGAGLAAAKRFAAEGAEVIVIGRDLEWDATNEQNVARLFATLGRKHGRLDILFLDAGSVGGSVGAWLALKHAIPILSEGAAVILDTSIVFRASRDSLFIAGAELAAGGVA